MIGYRDMTFCNYHLICKDGKKCERALTEKVREDAEKWMKNAPISIFADKPECWEENYK